MLMSLSSGRVAGLVAVCELAERGRRVLIVDQENAANVGGQAPRSSTCSVIIASGGIGGNHDLVRKNWPKRMGRVPEQLLSGVPAHVDGRMIGISESAGAHIINSDRMWHYTEGITNYNPIWPMHGIRILPGPSSLWLDAAGKRRPATLYPGFDPSAHWSTSPAPARTTPGSR